MDIKYKFWNKVKEEWCDNDFDIELSQSEEDETVFEYGNMVYADNMDELVFIPCVFIGRKDKNSVDIYTNYKVKISTGYHEGVMGMVYYDNDTCSFRIIADRDNEITDFSYGLEVEVIGNVFEKDQP